MSFYHPLVIHKFVWERLKRQTDRKTPIEKPGKYYENNHKELIEKSQEWIKAWPDSVEDEIKKLREQKKKQHEKDMALLKERKKSKIKTFRTEAVKKARKLIFEDSCYGKQLLSALIESKTLEERDAQVQFQRKIKQESIEDPMTKTSLYCTFNLDENYTKNMEQTKSRAVECMNENKWMQKQKEKDAEYLLKQQSYEIKLLLIDKIDLQDEIMKDYQESLKEYDISRDEYKEYRKKQDELDDALIKAYQREQERRKYKIQKILKEIHKDKQKTVLLRHVYKIIKDCQEAQNKRYQFIEDRIQAIKQQDIIKDKKDEEKAQLKRKELQSMFNQNIDMNKEKPKCSDKYICDKQCLIPNSCKDKRKKSRNRNHHGHHDSRNLSFLKPQNKLVDELKKRAEEPSSWSGTKAAHEHFAQVADQTLQECTYKNMARKVVDNYRRLHNLDSTSLLVSNY